MITIQNLEIHIDVEGDDDKRTFARMFNECIKQWATEVEQRKKQEKQSDQNRAIVGEHKGVDR